VHVACTSPIYYRLLHSISKLVRRNVAEYPIVYPTTATQATLYQLAGFSSLVRAADRSVSAAELDSRAIYSTANRMARRRDQPRVYALRDERRCIIYKMLHDSSNGKRRHDVVILAATLPVAVRNEGSFRRFRSGREGAN